jgi:hypothetical protein
VCKLNRHRRPQARTSTGTDLSLTASHPSSSRNQKSSSNKFKTPKQVSTRVVKCFTPVKPTAPTPGPALYPIVSGPSKHQLHIVDTSITARTPFAISAFKNTFAQVSGEQVDGLLTLCLFISEISLLSSTFQTASSLPLQHLSRNRLEINCSAEGSCRLLMSSFL